MFGDKQVSDKELAATVNKRLLRGGGGGTITATTRQGTVTLAGKIQHDSQRRTLVKLVAAIAGVRHVIDQLTLAPKRTF